MLSLESNEIMLWLRNFYNFLNLNKTEILNDVECTILGHKHIEERLLAESSYAQPIHR